MEDEQNRGEAPLEALGTQSPPSSRSVRSRRRVMESDHPARDAETALERTLRAEQRIMAETGLDAQAICSQRR